MKIIYRSQEWGTSGKHFLFGPPKPIGTRPKFVGPIKPSRSLPKAQINVT